MTLCLQSFGSAVSHEYFTVCLPPDEFTLLPFFLPRLLLLSFFYPGDYEEGSLVLASLPQVHPPLVPHSIYSTCSAAVFLLLAIPHLRWCFYQEPVSGPHAFEKQWTKRGETDRCFTLHTQERKQERGSSAAPSASPLLSPPCTQMFRYPLPLRPLDLQNVWHAAGSHGNVVKRITAWQKMRGFPLPTGGGEEAALITTMRGNTGSPRIEHLVMFLFYSDSTVLLYINYTLMYVFFRCWKVQYCIHIQILISHLAYLD